MPRPRAHAPNKQGGRPVGQDTSSYTLFLGGNRRWVSLHHDVEYKEPQAAQTYCMSKPARKHYQDYRSQKRAEL